MYHIIAYFATFFVTILCISMIRPVAIRIRLIDHPNERKRHFEPIPLIGGIGMAFGLLIGVIMLGVSLAEFRALIISVGILVFVGILDDFHDISRRARLLAQALVGLIMIFYGNILIRYIGPVFFWGNTQHLGWLAIPCTILAIMMMINAMNMIDGSDGLSGTVALIQLAFLSFIAFSIQDHSAFYILITVAAAVLGFLVFNFPWFRRRKRKVFMGDVGSMMLGAILIWFAIRFSQDQKAIHQFNPVIYLWIFTVPLFDLVNVMYRRLTSGRSPFSADNEHLHHLLRNAGCGSLRTVCIIGGFSLVFSLIGLFAEYLRAPEYVMALGYVLCFLLYLYFINHHNKFLWVLAPRKTK